jgi:hypothetical protein
LRVGCGEAVLCRVQDVGLVGFELKQVMMLRFHDDFGQIPLAIQGIAGQQPQRRIGGEQLSQMCFEHGRLGTFVARQRPLAKAHLHVVGEHVEHLHRIAVGLFALLTSLAVDRRYQALPIGQYVLEPLAKRRLKFG